ncbi:hypothetical protein SPRG_14566 [Saprolegnia parasitica CBS 223.65]|uniref:Uncharacterized protein n=1 Tax=Saprolegnia parasitica (strain CBS 223.65) TaxID=695850 RepID=A0A067BT27_SAPPC|nr:hypothetical protein SPRG_14566 [Saprolegnia parasitica CBS 223.65]KDO19985.1 hypothetical protein SPRG_14566 [Saprolegnia parasitica CBS 223.65]|eukprot:XP_012209290.1 hypothetical protein SPRG_14566 [Saprolegnia parasitica CBS 223.65]
MRGVTPILLSTLQSLLLPATGGRPPNSFGPSLMLVAQTSSANDAILLSDGRHSVWCILQRGVLASLQDEFPHIETVHGLHGFTIRVPKFRYDTPWRHMKRAIGAITASRVCIVVDALDVVDATHVHVPETLLVTRDPSLLAVLSSMMVAQLEARLLAESAVPHAFQIEALRVTDCIIPPDQAQKLHESAPLACANQDIETNFIPVESDDDDESQDIVSSQVAPSQATNRANETQRHAADQAPEPAAPRLSTPASSSVPTTTHVAPVSASTRATAPLAAVAPTTGNGASARPLPSTAQLESSPQRRVENSPDSARRLEPSKASPQRRKRAASPAADSSARKRAQSQATTTSPVTGRRSTHDAPSPVTDAPSPVLRQTSSVSGFVFPPSHRPAGQATSSILDTTTAALSANTDTVARCTTPHSSPNRTQASTIPEVLSRLPPRMREPSAPASPSLSHVLSRLPSKPSPIKSTKAPARTLESRDDGAIACIDLTQDDIEDDDDVVCATKRKPPSPSLWPEASQQPIAIVDEDDDETQMPPSSPRRQDEAQDTRHSRDTGRDLFVMDFGGPQTQYFNSQETADDDADSQATVSSPDSDRENDVGAAMDNGLWLTQPMTEPSHSIEPVLASQASGPHRAQANASRPDQVQERAADDQAPASSDVVSAPSTSAPADVAAPDAPRSTPTAVPDAATAAPEASQTGLATDAPVANSGAIETQANDRAESRPQQPRPAKVARRAAVRCLCEPTPVVPPPYSSFRYVWGNGRLSVVAVPRPPQEFEAELRRHFATSAQRRTGT